METAIVVICFLMAGLGAIIGACLTTINLRKAFIFTIQNDTPYVIDAEINYFTKKVVIHEVAKPTARAKRTK